MSTFIYQGTQFDATKMHTKALIRMLRTISDYGYCECCHVPEYLAQAAETERELRPILQAELAKREHIPNKKEAKEIRRQKQKIRKNLKNSNYVNAR